MDNKHNNGYDKNSNEVIRGNEYYDNTDSIRDGSRYSNSYNSGYGNNQRHQENYYQRSNNNNNNNYNYNVAQEAYSHSSTNNNMNSYSNPSRGYINTAKTKKSGSIFKKIVIALIIGIFFGMGFIGSSYALSNIAGISSIWTDKKTEKYEGIESADEESSSDSLITEEKANEDEDRGNIPNSADIKSTETANVTAVVTDVTDVVEKVMPSVVSITADVVYSRDFFGEVIMEEGENSGSGIIIGTNSDELLVVTNNHVSEDSKVLHVQFIDGDVVEAVVKGNNPAMDLAVLAIKLSDIKQSTRDMISVAVLGDSKTLKVGEPAIAIGNALGYGQSVTTGVISALDRSLEMDEFSGDSSIKQLIQTDAAINFGNSGGALVNIKGEVIGINSNKLGGDSVEGMGYAIPISIAIPIIDELIVKETRYKVAEEDKGYIGISGIDVDSVNSQRYDIPVGVYVTQVYRRSGAAEAGIKEADVIVKLNGEDVRSMQELQQKLSYYKKGDIVEIAVRREMAQGQYSNDEDIIRIVLKGAGVIEEE